MSAKRLARSAAANGAPQTVTIVVDGASVKVLSGSSVAAALLSAHVSTFRESVTGEPRAAVCGMGICFECRVTIDGAPHQRSCLVTVRGGMSILTRAIT